MNKAKILLLASTLILIMLILVYLMVWGNKSASLTTNKTLPIKVCTLEARICPDGSSVGRSGPQCEFTACPNSDNEVLTGTTTSATSTITNPVTDPSYISLNQIFTEKEITITPLNVIEDSRCPVDVQCIQAGTVTLKTRLENSSKIEEVTLTLNKSLLFNGKEITLVEALPVPKVSDKGNLRQYAFKFTVN